MTDLLDVLYTYTRENRVRPLLSDTDYRAEESAAEAREAELRGRLTGEDLHALEVLTGLREDLWLLEQRALFRAALSLGLELARF